MIGKLPVHWITKPEFEVHPAKLLLFVPNDNVLTRRFTINNDLDTVRELTEVKGSLTNSHLFKKTSRRG